MSKAIKPRKSDESHVQHITWTNGLKGKTKTTAFVRLPGVRVKRRRSFIGVTGKAVEGIEDVNLATNPL